MDVCRNFFLFGKIQPCAKREETVQPCQTYFPLRQPLQRKPIRTQDTYNLLWGNLRKTSEMLIIDWQRSKDGEQEVHTNCFNLTKVVKLNTSQPVADCCRIRLVCRRYKSCRSLRSTWKLESSFISSADQRREIWASCMGRQGRSAATATA